MKINGQELTLEIWDTAGQEIYKGPNKIFMKK
jgi:GTPase SAR1 family protein